MKGISKTNILRSVMVTIAMSLSLCSIASGNRLSLQDQARVRTLVKYLNIMQNTSQDIMVRALAKMDPEAVQTLEMMGVQVTQIQGDLYSLYFDVTQLGEIRKVEGVKQVDLSREMRPLGQPSIKKGEPRQVVRPI